MPTWIHACDSDQRRLSAIALLLASHPHLIDQIFDSAEPCLRATPQALMRGRSSGERVLIAIAIDLWNGSGGARILDLDRLDSVNFRNFIKAVEFLRG